METIITKDIFGNRIEMRGTIVGEKMHGYNLPSGGWGLNPQDGATPAEFILFRPYKKKKVKAINKRDLVTSQ